MFKTVNYSTSRFQLHVPEISIVNEYNPQLERCISYWGTAIGLSMNLLINFIVSLVVLGDEILFLKFIFVMSKQGIFSVSYCNACLLPNHLTYWCISSRHAVQNIIGQKHIHQSLKALLSCAQPKIVCDPVMNLNDNNSTSKEIVTFFWWRESIGYEYGWDVLKILAVQYTICSLAFLISNYVFLFSWWMCFSARSSCS